MTGPHAVREFNGFTLVELLVVIAIIGVLIALLLPAVQSAREAARKMQCAGKFSQIGVAMSNYLAAKGVYPAGCQLWTVRGESGRPPCANPPVSEDPQGNDRWYGWGWGTFILPFMEEGAVYDRFDFHRGKRNQHGYAEKNSVSFRAAATPVEAYLCPSDPQGFELVDCDPVGPCGGRQNGTDELEDCAKTNMVGCMGTGRRPDGRREAYWCVDGSGPRGFGNGMLYNRSRLSASDVSDGTSQTLLVGEVVGDVKGSYNGYFWATWGILDMFSPINHARNMVPQADPTQPLGFADSQSRNGHIPWGDGSRTSFASWHIGGCHFVFADGSVHFLSERTSYHVLEALASRNLGDMVAGYE